MPAPLDVDKEQIRMLVLAVGVTEAAKQTGIDLSTVKQWSARGKWLAHTRKPPERQQMPLSMQPRAVTLVTSPADALENTLKERRAQTRLGLSEYAARASRQAAELPDDELLARSVEVKAVASVAESVWPSERGGGSVQVSIFSATVEPADDSPIVDV